MKAYLLIILMLIFLFSCSPVGRFGAGVDITFDPRTIGMQIDDTIMQKNLVADCLWVRKIFFKYASRSIRWSIFLSGKVDEPEKK